MINNSTNESYSTSSASSTYHYPTVESCAAEDQSCTSSGQVDDLKPAYTDEHIEAIEKETAAKLNLLITEQKITRSRILNVSIGQKERLRDSARAHLDSDRIDPKKRHEYQNIYNSLSNDIAAYQKELEDLG